MESTADFKHNNVSYQSYQIKTQEEKNVGHAIYDRTNAYGNISASASGTGSLRLQARVPA